jgi:hypothetical protein
MKKIILLCCLSFLVISCKKNITIEKEQVIDNVIYELNPQVVYQSSSEKTKQKSAQQFLSILYANLFQISIPQNDLAELTDVRKANGDKAAIDEIIINSFINDSNIIIPTNAAMRSDIEAFIEATYIRFYLRLPTAYEVYYLKNKIEDDADLTPKLIYTSFALSNEYKYY